jgi:predicted ATPase/DNA-binding winged helix-turn-helix (wHTH) protein
MVELPVPADESYAFGPFELLPARQLISKDGVPLRLGGRAFDMLTILLRHNGQVVGKQQLMALVWPGVVVEEANLKVNIAVLRRALGDNPDQPRYIATVVGRGYRFVAPVVAISSRGPELKAGAEALSTSSLPGRVAPIFGRSAAIASIIDEFETGRLVSIVGPGGMGKTTVALAVARELAATFPDGVWFVDLTPLTADADVYTAIADALSIAAPTEVVPLLVGRNLLLVLDNCEHVIDAIANCVDTLLARTRDVKLLVTSREPLSIRGERVRRLSGLAVPPAGNQVRASDALEYSAVQLFVDRAGSRSPAFRFDDANAPIVSEICRRLDGLALGIERVALQTDWLDVTQMVQHIDARLHMLDSHTTGPERHRTLMASVDWSYTLLAPEERAVLRRLSVFSGAFSLEAACALSVDEGTAADVIQIVAGLASKSLVSLVTQDGVVEYRLTNIARAFTLDRLVAHGEATEVRLRQARYVLALLKAADGEPHGDGVDPNDVCGVLRWCLGEPAAAELAIPLVAAAVPFLSRHGLLEECRAVVTSALGDRFRPYRTAALDEHFYATLEATRTPIVRHNANKYFQAG